MDEKETADEALFERNMLALLLARGYYWHEGWKVLVCDIPTGQLTFHVPKDFNTKDLPEIKPCWDGHTTEEKWGLVIQHLHQRNTPPFNFVKRAGSCHAYEQRMLAATKSQDAAEIKALAVDSQTLVRMAVASNVTCPTPVLERLALDPAFAVRLVAGLNSKLTKGVQYSDEVGVIRPGDALPEDVDWGFPSSSIMMGNEVSFLSYYHFAAYYASRTENAQIMARLAKDYEICVRASIAENPHLPHDVSMMLLHDRSPLVRAQLASNPDVQPDILEALLKDSSVYVREQLACNHSTVPEILKPLANDRHYFVRRSVARNSATPVSVLQMLSCDHEKSVRSAVMRNPTTSREALDAMKRWHRTRKVGQAP